MTSEKPMRRMATCDAERELCHHAERASEDAADSAVKKVFAILGVDIDRPESIEEFRADLRFGRKLRRIADHGTLAFIGIVAAALAAAIWAGVVSKISGGN